MTLTRVNGLAAAIVVSNLLLMALMYNFVCWHYFRGYNEVTNMVVGPAVGVASWVNIVCAFVIWSQRLRKQFSFTPIPVAFSISALLFAVSPLFCPAIGRFANRNLWISTPLIEAASYGDAPTVMAMITHGENPNMRHPSHGTTPLHYMAYNGETEAVQLLLEMGADPTAQARSSLETPLHWAVRARASLATIRALVEHGAIPTLEDDDGKTPISYTEAIPEPVASEIRNALQPSPY